MRVLVSDTSILIDLNRAGFLETVFSLPLSFAVPDVLYHREIEADWGVQLVALGLRVEEVSAEGVSKALRYRTTKRALSVPDSFALALAEEQQWTLLTGDGLLRELAIAENVVCHGVLWLFDQMEQHTAETLPNLHRGLKALADHPRCRLPRYEIKARLETVFDALNADPLDLANADVVVASIVKARGFGVSMPSHALRDFDAAAIFQIVRNAGGPEGMAANSGFKAGIGSAPTDHVPNIRAAHGAIR